MAAAYKAVLYRPIVGRSALASGTELLCTRPFPYYYRVNMSEGGGSLLNALKLKLLEEQKELQELRINLENCKDELKVETEQKSEVIGCSTYIGPVYKPDRRV